MKSQGEDSPDVGQLLNIIRLSERDQDGEHKHSSVEPRVDGDKDLRYLDSLARLMTSNEKCVAVCKPGGELLVASNSELPEYAKTYINILQAYLNEPNKENYKQLELEAQQQVSDKITAGKDIEIERNYGFLEKDSTTHSLYKSIKTHYRSGTKETLDQVIHECNMIISLERGLIDKETFRDVSSIIRPLIDTQVLVNEINKDQNQLLKQAIQEGKVHYVEGETGKHAEVKISERLYNTRDSMTNGEYYIGITKLTCGPCDMALETFAEATGKDIKLRYAGTHGGTYRSWQMPKWLKSDNPAYNTFVGKLTQICSTDYKWDKAAETTTILREDIDLFLESLTRKVSPVKGEEVAKGTGASRSTVIQTKEARDTMLEVAAGGSGSSTLSTHAETLGKRPRSPEETVHAQIEHEGASEASRIMQFLVKEKDKSPRSNPARPSGGRDSPAKGGDQSGGARGRG